MEIQRDQDKSMRDIFSKVSNLPLREREIFLGKVKERFPAALQQFPIFPRVRTHNLPLSFAQQRLWFIDQLEMGSTAYIIPLGFRWRGPLQTASLQRSLQEIVQRHEILRTTFRLEGENLVQKIADHLPIPLPVINLQGIAPQQREHALQTLAEQEVQRPYHLERGPLLRTLLLRLEQQEHVLILSLHHIIFDGWSVRIFFQELTSLYEAFTMGRASPLEKLPIQYADFVLWQREWLQGAELERLLGYWERQLYGAPPLLKLPTDYPRPAVQTFRGGTIPISVSAELTARLKAVSRQEGATLFMTLLAAFQLVLSRYIDQKDILVGVPIANRPQVELQNLLGFFINTLVLRTDFTGDPTFREVLRRVRTTALEAYAHQSLPFEKLVEALQPERSLSRTPLIQVMCGLQSAPLESARLPSLQLESLSLEKDTAKLDLILSLVEVGEQLEGHLKYSSDIFKLETIQRLAGHLQVVWEQIAANPDRKIKYIPLLTQEEWTQLVQSQTQPARDEFCSVHRLFEKQAQQTPNAIAAVYGDASLTYREINMRANQLAYYLHRLGIGPEVLVGIYMERSFALLISLLAVLKAGGAYIPLDTTSPHERLSLIIQNCNASLVLSQREISADLSYTNTVYIEDCEMLLASLPDTNLPCQVDPENLAYCIYTSGSTGQPKGVMISHTALAHYVTWAAEAYDLPNSNGTPLHTSISFDLTVTSLFPALITGKPVLLLTEQQGIESLLPLFYEHAQNCVKLTPAHLSFLSQLIAQDTTGKEYQPQTFIIGGEALFSETALLWQSCFPSSRLINEYGPTEACVGCCIYELPITAEYSGALPIGRPIAQTQLYVLDAWMQPVPQGVYGELYIGGLGLARGYQNSPELTAERFVPHPFSEVPSERLYKTGDQVRLLPDGKLQFLGRLDQQIKIRGFRVEPGEIESALTQHPAVRAAIVLANEETAREKRLIAYVVAQAAAEPSVSELRRFLQRHLPDYMMPATFVLLDAFPLNSHGKVDRQGLPAPGFTRPDLEQAYVMPRSQVERMLACLWAEILGIEQVGIHDNFFELGGDSLLSIQVVVRANEIGIQLTLRLMYQHQTIAELASLVPQSVQPEFITEGIDEVSLYWEEKE